MAVMMEPLPGPAAPEDAVSTTWQRVGAEVLSGVQTLFSAAVYATLIVTFCFQVARVDGLSMAPTLQDHDRLIVNKLVYELGEPRPGDIVMLYYPLNPEKMFVKRVIAKEGDTVRIVDGHVYVNDIPLHDDYVPRRIPQPRRLGPDGRPAGLLLRDGRSPQQQLGQPPLGTGAEEIHCRQGEGPLVAAAGRQDLLAVIVPQQCTVLIAAPALMPALKERTAAERRRTAGVSPIRTRCARSTSSPSGARRWSPSIAPSPPRPRGAALINRIKADPSLTQSEIRVVSHDSSDARAVVGRRTRHARLDRRGQRRADADGAARSIEQRHARRAARHDRQRRRSAGRRQCGRRWWICRSAGAQVLSATVLKPNQRVRVTLADDRGTFSVNRRDRVGHVRDSAALSARGFEFHRRAGLELRDQSAYRALRPNPRRRAITSSLRMVSSRSEPVETIAAGTPDTSSRRAM